MVLDPWGILVVIPDQVARRADLVILVVLVP